MNQKQAKRINKYAKMRTAGKEVEYQPMHPVRMWSKDDPMHIGHSAIFLGQVKLVKDCLRAEKQRMKKYFLTLNSKQRSINA